VTDWVRHVLELRAPRAPVRVLEIGSLDINGGVRPLFAELVAGGAYIGIDAQPGPGVDVVADGSVYKSNLPFSVVVTTEVFEHTALWPKIIRNAHKLLVPGGLFIATMAGEGRHRHSAIDENPIRDWEYYKNVTEPMLSEQLTIFSSFEVNVKDADTRCWAIK